jgi:hypothetical protein
MVWRWRPRSPAPDAIRGLRGTVHTFPVEYRQNANVTLIDLWDQTVAQSDVPVGETAPHLHAEQIRKNLEECRTKVVTNLSKLHCLDTVVVVGAEARRSPRNEVKVREKEPVTP